MDSSGLKAYYDQYHSWNGLPVNHGRSLYPCRPWLAYSGVAAATDSGNIGLKGIIAGGLYISNKY